VVNPNRHIKIALVGDSLSKGGAEKVHALLSNYFFQNSFEVHNCILIDAVTYEYSGSLLNLGKIKANSSSVVRKFYRFRALQKWISTNNFDCLIDFRMRPSFVLESVLSRIIYPINAIYTVHSGFLRFYFPKNNFDVLFHEPFWCLRYVSKMFLLSCYSILRYLNVLFPLLFFAFFSNNNTVRIDKKELFVDQSYAPSLQGLRMTMMRL